MTDIEKLAFTYRAKLIIDNLKNCNSGAEVHEVGNMKQTAQGVLDVINGVPTSDITDDQIEGILGRLEAQQIAFFKKKFEFLEKSDHTDTTQTTHTQTQTTKTDKPMVQTQSQAPDKDAPKK